MKPGKSAGAQIPLKSTRLLDQVRERIRYFHDSLSTETTYVHWMKFFVRWHGCAEVARHSQPARCFGSLALSIFNER
jgi:hypothetical protein